MKKQHFRFILFLFLFFSPLLLNAAQEGLKNKLEALAGVSEVSDLKSSYYNEKYVVMFKHQLDYKNSLS